MAIYFECKKCRKTIVQDDKKFGMPVYCSNCKTINKIPGVAFQHQASKQQLELMHKSLMRHRQALLVFYISLPIFILVTIFAIAMSANCSWLIIPLGLTTCFAAILLLDRTSTSSKYLGRSPATVFLWFCFFSLVFFVMSITSYFRLKKRLMILVEDGGRED